jgi:hypothetical protein
MVERVLNLEEVKAKDIKSTVLRECSKETILSELIYLPGREKLKQVASKAGCYFILSRESEGEAWVFRNIGTYHGSVRERLRQHCYARKGTQPHSQKYEIHKSSAQWAVTYRVIAPIELRYTVEEFLIKHFRPLDNSKHNKMLIDEVEIGGLSNNS